MEDFPGRKIRTVDSFSSTLGEALLVLRAFTLREKGMSLDETADTILALRPRIAHYFTVDDLFYISRGGRISGAKALLGTVLNIKPMCKGDEHGHIVMNGKVRGRAQSHPGPWQKSMTSWSAILGTRPSSSPTATAARTPRPWRSWSAGTIPPRSSSSPSSTPPTAAMPAPAPWEFSLKGMKTPASIDPCPVGIFVLK